MNPTHLLSSASRELERAAVATGTERGYHLRQALQLLEGIETAERERQAVQDLERFAEIRERLQGVQEGSP